MNVSWCSSVAQVFRIAFVRMGLLDGGTSGDASPKFMVIEVGLIQPGDYTMCKKEASATGRSLTTPDALTRHYCCALELVRSVSNPEQKEANISDSQAGYPIFDVMCCHLNVEPPPSLSRGLL